MKNTAALVIDCRNRFLQIFVASVTQAQGDNPYQLVLRHALDMGHLPALLAATQQELYLGGGETVTTKSFRADMPVIVMGTYSAMSSAGHLEVHHSQKTGHDESRDGYRKVLIVGGLGGVFDKPGKPKRALRVLGIPIVGTLIRGPVDVKEIAGSGNSNCASADAALAGVKLLVSTDRKSVFLAEGQSDSTYVVRFQSATKEGETQFQAEHREEMFSRESIVRKMVLSAAYWELARGRDESDKPFGEEVKAVAKRRMEAYLAAKSDRQDRYWECLGRNFGALNMIDEAIAKIAEELGVGALANAS